MKKLTLLILPLLFFIPSTHAGECEKITDVNDYWVEVTSGVNIRDQVCDGNVIGSLSAGTKVKVTGHIENWRYIETPDGGMGFVWSDFVENTTEPNADYEFSSEDLEILFDIQGHQYEEAIRYLSNEGIISGYPDRSYKPEKFVNRAEFTKILVEAKLEREPTEFAKDCFPDVKKTDWFASYVCYAKEAGIIEGNPDGSFNPGGDINLAEASKILVNTMDIDTNNYVGNEWYEIFIMGMQSKAYIPDSFSEVSQLVNRSQMAEMVYRIKENLRDRPSKVFNFSSQPEGEWVNPDRPCIDEAVPSSVDMSAVRSAWIDWHNEAREQRGIDPLASNEGLDYTSSVWATVNKKIEEITHNRPADQDMAEWFLDNGITFEEKSGKIFGENLGLRTFRCSDADCTEEALEAAKYIFDAFIAEEGTDYTGHYDNIVEEDFIEIGLGIAVDSSNGLMYLTTQYSFGVESHIPVKTCSNN